ncbi:MAG: IS3 family transposase [Candidatus Mcinerneyibacterium aminivorans]|uniref:IS3 family transposase n=1 Tax=Candidatus Mcinerneyibacterium aminivorans TaxID=2703815 RepID=A0A5D0MFN4_9BACT|nr:MAG: IS3 family transposase [Candidatus Mcinerneyibacterium aminivorans]
MIQRIEEEELTELIEKQKATYKITIMCKLYEIPRSTYYDRITREESDLSKTNRMLKEKINKIYHDSNKIYGSPKITKILKNKGHKISIKRTQRLMRELGIRSITCRKYNHYSSQSNNDFEGKNLLQQNFDTKDLKEKWVTDITYVHTVNDGWCYLASVMDLHTNKIVGYAFAKHMKKELVIKAIENAYKSEGLKNDNQIILHSDRGSQYTSKKYRSIIREKGLILSYSDKGNPYDNACMESFHSILKTEETKRRTYYNYKEAKLVIFEFIESWYNRRRIHGSIDYMTPIEYERKCVA